MLMVIFGAGASFDSAPSYPNRYTRGLSGPGTDVVYVSRLPLADELFDDRPEFAAAMTRFPECQPIIPLLRHRRDDAPVEAVLERLQSEAETYPEGHRQLAAIRYYLQVMIWHCEAKWQTIHNGVTNYKALLDQIHRQLAKVQKVCLVTFNYDRMLEAALPTVGIRIESINDYVNSSEYKIIKLHGSVDWGRVIDKLPFRDLHALQPDQVPAQVIRLAPELLIGQSVRRNFVLVRRCPMDKSNDTAVYPAIAIPVERKLDFECPDYHLEVLKKCIRETRRLLLIGWRATDEPFLKLLRENLPSHILVMVVAGSREEAERIVERLRNTGMTGRQFLRTNGGFTDFMRLGEAENFLKS